MEEIDYKLKSKNVILITDAINKLLELITANKSAEVEDINYPLTFLKEKCASEDTVISLTAGRGFLNLISRGYLDVAPAMSVAMSMLPTAKNFSAITNVISGILGLIVEQQIVQSKDGEFSCVWSLTSPLHPLVMVLNQHPLAADDILQQVESLCLYNSRISKHSIDLMRPIFLWILCDPSEKLSPQTYQKCVAVLRGLEDCPHYVDLVLECLLLQQKSSPLKRVNFLTTYLLNMACSTNNDDLLQTVLIVMGDLVVHTIQNGEDPRSYLKQIQAFINHPSVGICMDVLLAILSEAILICPVFYSMELLMLCSSIQDCTGSSVSTYIFVSTLLQWLYYPTSLASDFNQLSKNTVDKIIKQFMKTQCDKSSNNTLKLNNNKILYLFKETNCRIFHYVELIGNHDKIVSNKDLFTLWTEKLKNSTNLNVQAQLVPFLNGILLQKSSTDCYVDKIQLISFIQDVCQERKDLAAGLLPVMLYRLRQTKNPSEMVALVQMIVNLAVTKENVPSIVKLLEIIKNEKLFPKSFLINLHVLLVTKQTRCYPYLQEFLLEGGGIGSGDSDWEVLTAKASAVKFLSMERSANFGAEMVPIISGLFSRCTDTSSSVAYCFALEALKGLWDSRVVSPVSTWKVLAPKVGKDKRTSVQVGVCKLLENIPGMRNETPEYDLLISNTIAKLWSYVVDSHNPDVTIAAFNALGNYKLEDMTLKQIPEIYRKGIELPSKFCTTPSDAARKPEDVLNYIPGEVWPNLFKYTNQDALEGVSNFCHKQISYEISQFRSGVYATITFKNEPQAVQHLPDTSLIRGLMNYVKKEALKPSYNCPETSFIECLSCLSRKLPRPLPPMLWNFLPDLWARGSFYKAIIIPLAAQQASVSYSCTRFLQNYLPCLDVSLEKKDECNKFLETLPTICISIEPDYIKDTLVKIFYQAIKTSSTNNEEDDDKNLFTVVSQAMKECLQSDSLMENNKIMISDIIEQSYAEFNIEDTLWSDYAQLCCELSLDYIERLTAPSSWWELTSEALRKAIYIRTLLGLKCSDKTGLVWLNEVIDASIFMPREHTFMLQKLYQVMSLSKTDESFQEWLLQLMARTQVHMVESSATENSVMFLCDVVILSVIMSSNYNVYTWRDGETLTTSKAARLTLFPQALYNALFSCSNEHLTKNCGQILEWLHHTRSSKLIPVKYSECFYLALMSCKCSSYFKKQSSWTKYLTVKPKFEIK